MNESVTNERADTDGETWLWDERLGKYVNPATRRTRDAANMPGTESMRTCEGMTITREERDRGLRELGEIQELGFRADQ